MDVLSGCCKKWVVKTNKINSIYIYNKIETTYDSWDANPGSTFEVELEFRWTFWRVCEHHHHISPSTLTKLKSLSGGFFLRYGKAGTSRWRCKAPNQWRDATAFLCGMRHGQAFHGPPSFIWGLNNGFQNHVFRTHCEGCLEIWKKQTVRQSSWLSKHLPYNNPHPYSAFTDGCTVSCQPSVKLCVKTNEQGRQRTPVATRTCSPPFFTNNLRCSMRHNAEGSRIQGLMDGF